MKVYLVRVRETHKIQGVFWAETIADLWDTVDEMGEPVCCEYAEMSRPSGLWHEISYAETPELPEGEHDCPPGVGGETLICATCLREETAVEEYFERMEFERSGELFPWRSDDQDEMDWTPFDSAFEGVGMIARIRGEVQ